MNCETESIVLEISKVKEEPGNKQIQPEPDAETTKCADENTPARSNEEGATEIAQRCPVDTMKSETESVVPELNEVQEASDSKEIKRDTAAEMIENGDENSSTNVQEEETNPYAYLERSGFTSEKYKIEIMNLHKYCTPNELKKFLSKQNIKPHKLKMGKGFAFVNFANEQERDLAMEKLKGTIMKGRTLDTKLAKPMMDPLMRKRKAEGNDDTSESDKKPKVIEPVIDQITKKSAPYADKSYSEQIALKKEKMVSVLSQLTREIKKANEKIFGYIKKQMEANDKLICPFDGVIQSPIDAQYRNKCDFTVGVNPETNELTIGFRVSSYKEGSCAVGPVSHLAFIPDKMKSTVHLFENFFRNSNRKAFNPEDHTGFWRQLLIRVNLVGDVLVIVIVNKAGATEEELDSIKIELKTFAEQHKISSLYFQLLAPRKSGEEPEVEHLAGNTALIEKLCGLEFSISPLAFFQVNTPAAEVLYNKIKDLACADPDTSVLDVCCGTGTIGLCLANTCRSVGGVELIPSAVEDAKKNAERNGIKNCTFVAGKAEDELGELIRKITYHEDSQDTKIVAVVDPPRGGLHRKCCQLLRNTEKIERVVYVSCDAQAAMKSFVDLCRATSNTYQGTPFVPVRAVAVDLFPDTPHCELLIVLERYSSRVAAEK